MIKIKKTKNILSLFIVGFLLVGCKKPEKKILGDWTQAYADKENGNYDILTFTESQKSQIQYVEGEFYRDYGNYKIVELTDNYFRLEDHEQTPYFFDKGFLWIDLSQGYDTYRAYERLK